jgi:hypothetical protein
MRYDQLAVRCGRVSKEEQETAAQKKDRQGSVESCNVHGQRDRTVTK